MIEVTRLDGSKYFINALLIETVESTPDTIISLIGGKKIVLKDNIDEVIENTVDFYRKIGLVNAEAHSKKE